MPRGQGFDRRPQHPHLVHELVVAVGIMLRHFHRFELLQAGFLGYLVFPLVGIVFQMPHIGDIAHVTNLVAQMLQVAEYDIERNRRTGMAQMRITVNRRSADIHPDQGRMQRFKGFLFPCQGVRYAQMIGFHYYILFNFITKQTRPPKPRRQGRRYPVIFPSGGVPERDRCKTADIPLSCFPRRRVRRCKMQGVARLRKAERTSVREHFRIPCATQQITPYHTPPLILPAKEATCFNGKTEARIPIHNPIATTASTSPTCQLTG